MARRSDNAVPLTGDQGRAARIIDVAQMAKVSRATAARVLGGYGNVGSETSQRVFEAARSLNYRSNDVARSMRSGRSLTIGVVAANLANSFFSGVVRAIIRTAAESAYQVLVLDSDDVIANEIDAVRVLSEKRVDGMIVAPASPTTVGHLTSLRDAGIPLVLLDRRLEKSGIGAVTTDDRRAAAQAVQLLVGRGHERIGVLVSATGGACVSNEMPDEAASTARDRFRGARKALADVGLALPSAWVRFSPPDVHNTTIAARELLSANPRPTAILTTNEEAALGLISACNELGLSIGREIALVSFDDTEWTRVLSPGISVVSRPLREMGERAVTLLLEQIGKAPARSIVLKAELIDRGSARAPLDKI